jgi:hypothetical protein
MARQQLPRCIKKITLKNGGMPIQGAGEATSR